MACSASLANRRQPGNILLSDECCRSAKRRRLYPRSWLPLNRPPVETLSALRAVAFLGLAASMLSIRGRHISLTSNAAKLRHVPRSNATKAIQLILLV